MAELKPVSTLMSSAASFGPDEDGEAVDQREYRSMIVSVDVWSSNIWIRIGRKAMM
jgi:hypothetical protein